MEESGTFRKSLLEKRQRSPTGFKPPSQLELDPMQRYNHVIKSYNVEENRVEDIRLQFMAESKSYRIFWRIISIPLILLLLELLILTPFAGLVIYLWQLYCIIIYFRGLRVYKLNKAQIEDPFLNMIFCPEICRITNSINKFYEIQVQDLNGFVFNQEIMKNLKLKEYQGKIKFMVYNHVFWDYFDGYPKLRERHIMVLVLATVVLAVQIILDILMLGGF